MRKLLNVGGGSKELASLPPMYQSWQQVLLDIDPKVKPDVVLDARNLSQLPAGEYDVVYCAHNLEHYYRHDGIKVLRGFHHVLKEDGFAHLVVPDMEHLMRIVVHNRLDIDDVLYQALAGPITVRDVIYGYGVEIERSGSDFFAHKTGFTQKSLSGLLTACQFARVFVGAANLEVIAYAFKNKPSPFAVSLLNLPADDRPPPS